MILISKWQQHLEIFWNSFAYNGSPNFVNDPYPHWPVFGENQWIADMNVPLTIQSDYFRERCIFWDQYS